MLSLGPTPSVEANLDRTTRKSLSMREYSTLIPIAFAYIYQQVPLDEWPRSLQVAPEWLQPLPQLSSSASSFSLIFVAPTKPATIHGLGDSFVSGHRTTSHDPRRRRRPARPFLLVQIADQDASCLITFDEMFTSFIVLTLLNFCRPGKRQQVAFDPPL